MKTCWFIRWWDALRAEADGAPSRWVRQHRLVCLECRVHAAREAALAGQLRAAADLTRQTAPPFLAGRIARNLPSAQPIASRSWWLRPAVATFASALLLTGACLWFVGGKTTSRPAIARTEPAGLIPAPERLLELGQQLDQPLNAELDAVVRDARSAVQFLASNFLPPASP